MFVFLLLILHWPSQSRDLTHLWSVMKTEVTNQSIPRRSVSLTSASNYEVDYIKSKTVLCFDRKIETRKMDVCKMEEIALIVKSRHRRVFLLKDTGFEKEVSPDVDWNVRWSIKH